MVLLAGSLGGEMFQMGQEGSWFFLLLLFLWRRPCVCVENLSLYTPNVHSHFQKERLFECCWNFASISFDPKTIMRLSETPTHNQTIISQSKLSTHTQTLWPCVCAHVFTLLPSVNSHVTREALVSAGNAPIYTHMHTQTPLLMMLHLLMVTNRGW